MMNFDLEILTSLRVRIGILLAVAFILFSVIAIRLWEMQVLHGPQYREKSQKQSIRTIRVPAVRGRILARDGTPLAVNEARKNAEGVRMALVNMGFPDERLLVTEMENNNIEISEVRLFVK